MARDRRKGPGSDDPGTGPRAPSRNLAAARDYHADMSPCLSSVLCALVAAGPPCGPDDFEATVEKALERARPALLRELRRAEGGELALLCLAAAHDRVPTDHRVFADALRRLSRTTLRDTYGLSLRLMVIAHVEGFPSRDETAERDTLLLLDNQAREGGFSYTAKPSNWDLSNTQYAALGLRAALYLQQDVPLQTWAGLARATLTARRDGGFAYTPGSAPTMSMTVAGIAILELCKQQFQRRSVPHRELNVAIEKGWRWMDAHLSDVGNLGSWHALYAHYGLERAAVLSARDEVGGEDWYRRGGTAILGLQLPSGGFRSPTSSERKTGAVDTAFAVLFLRRAFQAELGPRGPTTPGPTKLCHQLDADADDATIRRAVALDVARGDAAVPDLIAALKDGIGARRRAAAIAVLQIAGQDFRYHPARSDEQNAEAIRRIEGWWERRQRDRKR